ncbi:aminotransferase class I/II-fold pyridoxal phosphate-dependent enzyme [Nocardia terpenica]|uniref:Ornithine decarboxylase n=1 Tax=Nocardia terpenica TaxID=455432 RepID=A0A164P6N6_9NOCA|nr:ornithine decarboxylase [Nocardia terpenica]KZM75191.1 ornithine decarboxylase [Nocardia terpenica]NQE93373.1 ornithine decarboxylase [Nocardia terpenica]
MTTDRGQARAPMLEALAEYQRSGRYGFTPPGHRQGRGADPRVRAVLGGALGCDVLAAPGIDDRLTRSHLLGDAEELMAEAVGAQTAFFSTCGSSLSVKAAMMAVAGGDGGLILGRDSHKSVVAGLVFSGVQPYWVTPKWDAARHFSHPPSPQAVREAWERHPDAAGALIVSPSPYGTCADIAGIARVCHERGKPLIVDEAWGAHLPFHEDLPRWAMDAGADVCVVSVHKMGAGFEQGSVFHIQGELVDRSRLKLCADLLMTTSPNVLLYAAMDGWRRQMVEQGHELLGAALEIADYTRDGLATIPGVTVMHDELLGAEASHELDRLQVLCDVSDTGASGYQVADWLRENRRLDLGLSDHRRILATLSMADDKTTVDALIDALTAWRTRFRGPTAPPMVLPEPRDLQMTSVLRPREAFFGPCESIPIEQAPGRVAAEQVTPYPPGIPVLVPGELIDRAVVDYLRTGLDAGMNVPDPADPTSSTLRVVAH